MRNFLILIFCLFLFGCKTFVGSNTSGKIEDKGMLGETVVTSVGNADEAATISKEEVQVEMTHGPEDKFIIEYKSEKDGDVREIVEKIQRDDEKIVIQEPVKNLKVTYLPSKGATTTVKGAALEASTGTSGEDKAAVTAAILRNSKTIQYVGIALILGGLGVLGILKQRGQGSIVSGVGVGLIILQSTLANPIWSWVMVLGLVGLPVIWGYSYFRKRSLNKSLVIGIESLKQNYPDSTDGIKRTLGTVMSKSDRKEVKEIKAKNLSNN